MTYDVCYKETCIGWFTVEADSEEDAYDQFWKDVESGKIDLLDTEIMDSSATVYEQTSRMKGNK